MSGFSVKVSSFQCEGEGVGFPVSCHYAFRVKVYHSRRLIHSSTNPLVVPHYHRLGPLGGYK